MTDKPFKPLLAASLDGVDLKTLPYPLLWSPKLDGIRTLIVDGADDAKGNRVPGIQPATRKIKQLPNLKQREFLSRPELAGFDGELISGPVTDKDVFNSTTRIVMKGTGPGMRETVWLYTNVKNPDKPKPEMSFVEIENDPAKGIADVRRVDETNFYVFDDFSMKGLPFEMRIANAQTRIEQLPDDLKPFVRLVVHAEVQNDLELANVERIAVEEGYEGVMLRKAGGPYKFGRSTETEMTLAKVKRFADTDGVIIGYEELMHNDNELERDALGHAKRSSHQENLRPAGMLGAIIYRLSEFDNQTVKCGTGFTEADRIRIWNERESLLGTTDVLRYQPSGMKDLPRFPSWKGPRKD